MKAARIAPPMEGGKKRFNLYNISLARGFLYGLAILWIIFYHARLTLSGLPVLKFFKDHGDCGVDVFFFLSAISLYFSLKKNDNLKHFYFNRFVRIIPLFLMIYGTTFAISNIVSGSFVDFLLQVTTIYFFIHGIGVVPWFIPALILFYLFYPLLFKLFFNKYKCKGLSIAATILLVLGVCGVLRFFFPHLKPLMDRVPIMLIGTACGKLVYEKKELPFYAILLILAGFAGTLTLHLLYPKIEPLKYIFYIFYTFVFVILFSCIYLFNKKHCHMLNRPIELLGGYTLELYLIHENFMHSFIVALEKYGIATQYYGFPYQLACFVIAIILSVGVGKLYNALSDKIKAAYYKKFK